jgi:hypothetical protein
MPTCRQTFREGAWAKVAEIAKTFEVIYLKVKTLYHETFARCFDKDMFKSTQSIFRDFTT